MSDAPTSTSAGSEPPVLRLKVELRLAGMVATLWWVGLVHAWAWSYWVGPPSSDLGELPWGALVAPQVLALGLVLWHVYRELPRERWPRRRTIPRQRDARPWLVFGFPALVIVPLLWRRDREARHRRPSPAGVESAFQRLLEAPRSIALRFISWAAVAYIVDAVVLGAHSGWPRHVVIAMALLWLAILAPLAAMVHGWGRAMVRPELLCAPRPDPAAFERRTGLRTSLVIVATLASAGAIIAPLSASYLWLAIASPVRAPPRALIDLLYVGGVVTLVACAVAFALIAMDLASDVRRASEQVDAVVREVPPEPLLPGSLSTGEVYHLVGAVDGLVGRIRKATIAKYVAIEKAKEGDRLKSQFLANMSHDLRSPLNSILGFSELLLRGIDGDLEHDQSDMVQTIHDSGRELLLEIDDILDMAKLEAHRVDLHPEPTPPANLISRAIQNARPRQSGTIEYLTEVAPGLRPAFVDPFRTVQALTNILLFASEELSSGTLKINAREGRVRDGRRIFVQIETPLRPASTEQLARAREGFFRIPGHRGLGLGLPIANALLELGGGSLTMEDLGEGMLFSVALPSPQRRSSWLKMRALEERVKNPR